MSIEAKIADAIADLHAEIMSGASYGIVRPEIADEYGIKEDVLHIRFTKQHGDWSTLREREAQKVADRAVARDMDAKRIADLVGLGRMEGEAVRDFFRQHPAHLRNLGPRARRLIKDLAR